MALFFLFKQVVAQVFVLAVLLTLSLPILVPMLFVGWLADATREDRVELSK